MSFSYFFISLQRYKEEIYESKVYLSLFKGDIILPCTLREELLMLYFRLLP